MRVASAEQMRKIDSLTQESYGVPGLILMERAALGIIEALEDRFGELRGKKVYICCGKGNNGGDGLALARLLGEKKAAVTAVLAFDPDLYRGLALENLKLAEKFGVRLLQWGSLTPGELSGADFLVDALLGTGAQGSPEGVLAEIIRRINEVNKPVIAVDLPSGIQVDTGQISNPTIKACLTVTFGLPKPGLLCYPGADYCGNLIVKQVGFPEELLHSPELKINYPTAAEIRSLLPQRLSTAHKGSNGHVLVVGGSPGMTGAVSLACLGALRSGCGLVTAGLRMDLPFWEKPAEVMVVSWPDLLHSWDNYRSIVFGPGLSKMEDGESFLYGLLERAKAPLVIDADGLNLLAANKKLFKYINQPVILTPHPGEMARLTGLTVPEVQADRLGTARRFAEEWKVYLILKGTRTVIAAPDGFTFINPTGNPGMATGGMGDVLAGMIGGLAAQGMDIFNAGVAAVYIHGLAGDLAAEEMGCRGMVAGDLLPKIPLAIKKVLTS
ncbi:MAG: NAD(P)H-hydrate dehydratase [Bacillota bacterium]